MEMRANCNLDKFHPDIIACTITSPFTSLTSILLKISESGMRGSQNRTRRRKIRDLIRRRTRNLAKIGGEAHFSKSPRKRHWNLGSPASHTAPFRDIFRAHISGSRAAALSSSVRCRSQQFGDDSESRNKNASVKDFTSDATLARIQMVLRVQRL